MRHNSYDPDIDRQKWLNRAVFAETMRICNEGGYSTPSGKRVILPSNADVLKASVFYQDPPFVDSLPCVKESVCDVVNEDCVNVAHDLVNDGFNPIMLNMANRHTPGGGVLDGARAQEESLFRRSNLCVSLYQYSEYHARLLDVPRGNGAYPMDRNTGGIYSGKVMFFRESVHDGYSLMEDPFECAVVSVAAIRNPELDMEGQLPSWAVQATKSKMRTIFRIGLLHGHDAIVLGALGCGAFHNPPEHIAKLFHEVMDEDEFKDKFRCIRFAIIEDHNTRHSNFEPFEREFRAIRHCQLTYDSLGTINPQNVIAILFGSAGAQGIPAWIAIGTKNDDGTMEITEGHWHPEADSLYGGVNIKDICYHLPVLRTFLDNNSFEWICLDEMGAGISNWGEMYPGISRDSNWGMLNVGLGNVLWLKGAESMAKVMRAYRQKSNHKLYDIDAVCRCLSHRATITDMELAQAIKSRGRF